VALARRSRLALACSPAQQRRSQPSGAAPPRAVRMRLAAHVSELAATLTLTATLTAPASAAQTQRLSSAGSNTAPLLPAQYVRQAVGLPVRAMPPWRAACFLPPPLEVIPQQIQNLGRGWPARGAA
jgi:hypothetical protein